MAKGRLIVIEGLDGSGKATQAKLLAAHLAAAGPKGEGDHLPRLRQRFSAPSSRCIWPGEFGGKPDDVNAYAASSFYAVDRYASYKTDWGQFYAEGGVDHRRPLHHLQRGAPVLEAPA